MSVTWTPSGSPVSPPMPKSGRKASAKSMGTVNRIDAPRRVYTRQVSTATDGIEMISGIVDIGGELVGGNVWSLLFLLGAINLIVALFNLLPLLPFDGGHAAVVIYEQVASKIRGREVRVDFRKLVPVTALVLVVFLTLGLSAMFLDIRQIFSGS